MKNISDRVAVMYLGKLCEVGPAGALYATPAHPYTAALLDAVPEPDPDVPLSDESLTGDLPSPLTPPSGCRFRTRCPEVFEPCPEVDPALQDTGGGHMAACHLHGVVGTPVRVGDGARAGSPPP